MALMLISQHPDTRHFYLLSDPFSRAALRLTTAGSSDWLTQEQALALARGGAGRLPTTLKLRGQAGKRLTDILWTAMPPLVCAATRVVDAMAERRLTGWSTYPVEVIHQGEFLEGYQGLAILGRGGGRDRTKSPIIDKPAPVPGGKPYRAYRGLFFDEDPWDGSDLFFVDGFIVVTQPAHDYFVRSKVSNIRLTPISEVEIDVALDRYMGGE